MTMPGEPVPVDGYASVADYELRFGEVAEGDHNKIQTQLNEASGLVDVYLGPYRDLVAATYPTVLTSLVCQRVYRGNTLPYGVKSESVGAASVSYDTASGYWLAPDEQQLLDSLIGNVGGLSSSRTVGQIGVTWGGPEPQHSLADTDVWVLASRYGNPGWMQR